jgi:uncharacterized LabA/DUF88 family protein
MRIQIFIDGANFYHLALKPLGLKAVNFNFDEFALFLADGRDIVNLGKRFYIGSVREKEGDSKSKYAMSQQVKLFNQLKQTVWQIKTSKLREREERIIIDKRVANYKAIKKQGITEIKYKVFREKGIDVKIAIDLMAGALDDKYDAAIIVSSDTDLVPAIDWIRFRCKKQMEYVGFSIPDITKRTNGVRPTNALMNRTDVQRVLIESDIRQFQK